MESIYTELALYGSRNESAGTDTVLYLPFVYFLHKSLHTSRVSVVLKEQPTSKLTNNILYEYSN